MADEVILAHPLKVRAIADARIKTDKLDSEMLAHLLRADLIPEAYAPLEGGAGHKAGLEAKDVPCTPTNDGQKPPQGAPLVARVEPPPVSDLFGKKGLRWLREETELPEPDGRLLREEVELAETLKQKIRSTESLIAELAEGDEAVGWLRSLPGIGEFFSVLIRHEVGEMERFPSPKKFASYTGLVPSTYASGKRITHGRLTKEGNKWL